MTKLRHDSVTVPVAAIAAITPLVSCSTAKTADQQQQKPMNIVYIMSADDELL